jgi:peptidoglycan/xylan/chitin deacetylase (PgdA/CDA1 family)
LGLGGAAQRNDGRARILMLHGTPRRRERQLGRLLEYVRRHFEVVPLSAIVADSASRDVRFRRQVALTFDDGLANNIEVAYPVLQRLGLAATFFVCPGLVDTGRWLWNHEARERLRRLSTGALRELALQLGAPADVEGFVDWLKRQPLAARRSAESIVRAATPHFSASAEQRHEFDIAGWEDLRELDPRVVTIGAHTLTHPILTTLPPAEAEQEIAGSQRVLQARLHRPVRLFAYPNGDVDRAVHGIVRRYFDAAVSVEQGYVEPGCDPFMLPRVAFAWSGLRLARALHRDYERVAPMTTSGSQVAI